MAWMIRGILVLIWLGSLAILLHLVNWCGHLGARATRLYGASLAPPLGWWIVPWRWAKFRSFVVPAIAAVIGSESIAHCSQSGFLLEPGETYFSQPSDMSTLMTLTAFFHVGPAISFRTLSACRLSSVYLAALFR